MVPAGACREASRDRRPSIQGDAPPPQVFTKKKKRVDTSALTGLRGLAALQVATGHAVSGTNLWGGGVDLIGSAAMPFFFLLSGFVITLGYGQTSYSTKTCCCSMRGREVETDRSQPPMKKAKFWQNRFARLFPVYAATNLWSVGDHLSMYQSGGGNGLLGLITQLALAVLGMNSWVVAWFDAGMPRILFAGQSRQCRFSTGFSPSCCPAGSR